MRLVQPHHAEVVVVLVDEGDLVRLLQHLDIEVPENIGHRVLQTHVVRVRKNLAGQRDFAELLDHLRRLGLQDRIGVIADHQVEIARAGGQSRFVSHRAWTRERGAEAQPGMQPDAGKIRNRRGALRPPPVVWAKAGDTTAPATVIANRNSGRKLIFPSLSRLRQHFRAEARPFRFVLGRAAS